MSEKAIIISSGDPSGVGPEIALKFIADLPTHPLLKKLKQLLKSQKLSITLLGAKKVYSWYKKKYHYAFSFKKNQLLTSKFNFSFIDIPLASFNANSLGKINQHNGEHTYALLQKSVSWLKEKIPHSSPKSLGFITMPINKKAISLTHKSFKGHTDFLAKAFNLKGEISMTFFSPFFNLILTTDHIPLKEVSKALNGKNIQRSLQHSLEIKKFLGNEMPILILGLNPHAGEDGVLGNEEKIIEKIIEKSFDRKDFLGPLPADTAFLKVKEKQAKIVIAQYHDQGLIPLKTFAFNEAVNTTWGLPFIRTSVSHGTAYELAGKNLANPLSFYHAINQTLRLLNLT